MENEIKKDLIIGPTKINDDTYLISDQHTANRRLYFINEEVEWALAMFLQTGCTNVELRDKIMANAAELIRQVIRKQGLYTIYPGQEESAFGDLLQTAWCQLERVLYKYRARLHCRKCFSPDRPNDSVLYMPGELEYGIKTMDEIVKLVKKCPKCKTKLSSTPIVEPRQGRYGGSETILYKGMSKLFNLWSQISRTVILAYIKKEGRDRKNSPSYNTHISTRSRPSSDLVDRFISEARDACKHNDDYNKIINALEWLAYNDDKPYDGIISKLVSKTGLSRVIVTSFMKLLKLRSFEFTDSPLNREMNKAERKLLTDMSEEE